MSLKKQLNQHLQAQNGIIDTIGEQLNDLKQVRDYMTRRITEHELTPVQQKKMALYEFIYNQSIGNKWAEDELIDLIRAKAECSRPVAIHLLNDTKELFTTVLSINKQWELKRMLETNERLTKKAEMAHDFKACGIFEKNRAKILEQVEAIEKEIEEFKGHTFVISADPSIIGVKRTDKAELKELLEELKEKFDFEDAEIMNENE